MTSISLAAGPILEIALLLLGAVAAAWLARRVGLPAVVGYLVLGRPDDGSRMNQRFATFLTTSLSGF